VFAANGVNDSFKDSSGKLLAMGLVERARLAGAEPGDRLRDSLGAGDCRDVGTLIRPADFIAVRLGPPSDLNCIFEGVGRLDGAACPLDSMLTL
jgi:hypothetical protein